MGIKHGPKILDGIQGLRPGEQVWIVQFKTDVGQFQAFAIGTHHLKSSYEHPPLRILQAEKTDFRSDARDRPIHRSVKDQRHSRLAADADFAFAIDGKAGGGLSAPDEEVGRVKAQRTVPVHVRAGRAGHT